jgi:hypothetical protein
MNGMSVNLSGAGVAAVTAYGAPPCPGIFDQAREEDFRAFHLLFSAPQRPGREKGG